MGHVHLQNGGIQVLEAHALAPPPPNPAVVAIMVALTAESKTQVVMLEQVATQAVLSTVT